MDFQLDIPILEQVYRHLDKSVAKINGLKKEVADTSRKLTTVGWAGESSVAFAENSEQWETGFSVYINNLCIVRDTLKKVLGLAEDLNRQALSFAGIFGGNAAGSKKLLSLSRQSMAELCQSCKKVINDYDKYQIALQDLRKPNSEMKYSRLSLTNEINSSLREIEQNQSKLEELIKAIKNYEEGVNRLESAMMLWESSFVKPKGWSESGKNLLAMLGNLGVKIVDALAEVNSVGAFLASVLGLSKTCCQFGGDPVNMATGNFIYQKEYLKTKGLFPISFKMFYNAQEQRKNSLGFGWAHNFEVGVSEQEDKATVFFEDGKQEIFIKGDSGVYYQSQGADNSLKKNEGNLVYRTHNGLEYIFSPTGKLIREEDEYGNFLGFIYDEKGLLIKAVNNSNSSFSFSYENEKLAQITDNAGRKISFEYMEDALICVTDENNGKFQYSYTQNMLTGIINPCGINILNNEYDAIGRIKRQAFPDGGVIAYEYDDNEKKLIMTDQNGNETAYIHDERYRSAGTVYSDGFEKYEHNDLNHRTLYIDKKGAKTEYSYDNRGNAVKVTNPLNEAIETEYNRQNKPTRISICGDEKLRMTYDSGGNATVVTDALSRTTKTEYDKNGAPIKITRPDGSEIILGRDNRGNILTITEPGLETKYEYDELNRVIASIDGNGYKTGYEYNSKGDVTKVINADGFERGYEYNANGKVIKITDFNGSVIKREYNCLGMPGKITDQNGNEVKFEYDLMWNVSKRIDANGNETTFEYDKLNRLERVVNAAGSQVRYEYDPNGNTTKITGPRGEETYISYDPLNRITGITDPNGGKSSVEYNNKGKITGIVDPLGYKSVFEYDDAGQKISETDPSGRELKYSYTPLGQISHITDSAGRETKYEYMTGGLLERVTYPDGKSTAYAYDANRNIISGTSRDGYALNYEYDRLNQITCIYSNKGQVKKYSYDAVGNIISITDVYNKSTRYVYDAGGNLIEEYDRNGNKWSYSYNVNNQMTKTTDPLGRQTFVEYDPLGRVTMTISALGSKTQSFYNETGKLIKSVDSEGNVTSYVYDIIDRLMKTIKADGTAIQYEYNANGWLTSRTDEDGAITKYVYAPNGRVLSVTDALGGKTEYAYDAIGRTVSVKDALGGTTSSVYDKNGNLLSTTNALGGVTAYTYDEMNRVTSITDPLHGVTLSEYDASGNAAKITNADGGVTTFFYDLLNRLTKYTDPEGYDFSFTYDANGNILTRTDGRGNTSSSAYDGLDRAISITDKTGGVTSAEYDADGRLTKIINPEGAATRYEYNRTGNVIKAIDAYNNSTAFSYDRRGRVASMIDASGAVTRFTYTPAGKAADITDALGGVRKFEYDILDRLISESDELNRVTEYTYDALNRVLSVKNPLGHINKFTYDALGRITTVTDKNGNTTKYTHDANGNIIETIDAFNNSSYFEYDPMNRLVKVMLNRIDSRHAVSETQATLYTYDKRGLVTREINAAGDAAIYVYDGNSNLVQKTDADGYVTEYGYDPRNMVDAINYADGKEARFAYNKNGELATMTDWNGAVIFTLDLLDRIIGVNDHNGQVTGFAYDAVSNRTSVTFPDGTIANYTFDPLRRMTNLNDAENQNTKYTYDAANQLVAMAYPNNWDETYTYDAAGQLLTQLARDPLGKENNLVLHTYEYDPEGNVLHETRTGAGGQDKFDYTHTYDALNRLARTTGLFGYKERSYEYDSLGNLLYEKNANGAGKGNEYWYNNLNQQIRKVVDDKDEYTNSFDKRGNLIKRVYNKTPGGPAGDEINRQYIYDATNRMVKGINEKGEQSRYIFNGLGSLVANEWFTEKNAYGYHGAGVTLNPNERVGGGELALVHKDYVLDYATPLKNVIMETENGDGGLTYRYSYGVKKGNVVIYGIPNGADGVMQSHSYPAGSADIVKLHYHLDRLGSADYLTDNIAGKVASHATYDNWGAMTAKAAFKAGGRELDLAREYTGHPADMALGVYYAKARMYDAGDRRWLSPDLIRGAAVNPQSMNLYNYVSNNPLKYVDLLGLFLSGTRMEIGATGDDVLQVQKKLLELGYVTKALDEFGLTDNFFLDELGRFETYTLYAVNAYKNDRGLQNTGSDEGVIDAAMWRDLNLSFNSSIGDQFFGNITPVGGVRTHETKDKELRLEIATDPNTNRETVTVYYSPKFYLQMQYTYTVQYYDEFGYLYIVPITKTRDATAKEYTEYTARMVKGFEQWTKRNVDIQGISVDFIFNISPIQASSKSEANVKAVLGKNSRSIVWDTFVWNNKKTAAITLTTSEQDNISNTDWLQNLTSHEFGHVLGIWDAYSEWYNLFTAAPISPALPQSDVMRSRYWQLFTYSDLNYEMMLYAWSKGVSQTYVPSVFGEVSQAFYN